MPEAVNEIVQDKNAVEAPTEELHLLDLLIVFTERWRFILFFVLAAVILTVVVVILLPNEYTAETVLLPPSQSSSMGSSLLGQMGGSSALASMAGASLGLKTPGELYVSLFRTRTIEDAMVQRYGLLARYHVKKMSDGRKLFEKNAKIKLGTKDGLITISVTDADPKFASELANGYVDQFRNLSANLAITEASQRRQFFQQQLLDANQNLTKADEAMKATEHSTGVLQVDSQSRILIEAAASIRGQIVAKEVELQAMRSFATEDNPQMETAQQQLAALKSQLAKLSGTNADSSSEIIVPKGNIPEAGMQYIRSLRDVRYYETVEQLIARQFEMAKLDEAREGAIIQVADVAVPPDTHSFPKRSISVLAAAVFAGFLACGWCLLSAVMDRMRVTERGRIDKLQASFRRPKLIRMSGE